MDAKTSDTAITFLAAVPFHFHLRGRTQRLAWHLAESEWDIRYVAPPTPRAMLRHWIAPWRHRRAGCVRLVWPRPQFSNRAPRRAGRIDRSQINRLNRLLQTNRKHVLCISTPAWVPWLDHLRYDAVIYDCIDAPEVHVGRGSAAAYRQWHDRLAHRADVLVAVSEHLADRLRETTGRNALLCHNGVDVEHFIQAGRRDVSNHPRLTPGVDNWLAWRRQHTRARVAGFVGSIDSWVDTELIGRTARTHSNIRFVVAGPSRQRKLNEPLHALPNITLLGPLHYDLVPAVMHTFDVGLIPFKPGEVTACADPIKLYEHFALGQPVLATYPFRRDAVDAGLLRVASGENYADALHGMVTGPEPPDRVDRRRAFAADHDWKKLAERFAGYVTTAISRESS